MFKNLSTNKNRSYIKYDYFVYMIILIDEDLRKDIFNYFFLKRGHLLACSFEEWEETCIPFGGIGKLLKSCFCYISKAWPMNDTIISLLKLTLSVK